MNELDLHFERLLGEGSYGKVFLVKQDNGDQFAVKEIDLTKCDDAGRDQAHGEAHLLSRLKHANILMYVESVICDESLFIVTEFCEGGDLEDYLQLNKKLNQSVPEPVVSDWILQLGSALKYMHDQKILHRDMKTKNIFLKENLSVKLGDLGIAKVLDLNQSKADTFIGTPSYMSPELFMGKSYNHKTDIWGLGCCVYEMMTLKRAFQGRALWTLIREIKNGKVLETPDSYSLEIRMLVQEMMAQNPEERPSAKDIVNNDLLGYHRGSSIKLAKSLPHPNQKTDESAKKPPPSGSKSGSLKNALQEMNKSQEAKFRNTIESVCEKINTLRLNQQNTGTGTAQDFNTFVCKEGGSDSEEELEAPGTILDSSLLQHYAEELETFVLKGNETGDTKDLNSDKKVKTEINNIDNDDEDDDDEEGSRTLLRQYSETLDDNEADEENESSDVVMTIKGPQVVITGSQNSPQNLKEVEDEFNEMTLVEVSKYKYKGLQDTFALRPDKRWKRPKSDPYDWFSPGKETEGAAAQGVAKNSHTNVSRHETPPKSAQNIKAASFSSTTEFNSSKTTDPRLLRTLEGTGSKTRHKVPVADRIQQSAKDKNSYFSFTASDLLLSTPKQAFTQTVDEDLNIPEVMRHLKDNLSPSSSVDSRSETIRPAKPEMSLEDQGPGSSKAKKKKESYLKKQSEAKRKNSDVSDSGDVSSSLNNNDIKLFTRAQAAKFSKLLDAESPVLVENGNYSIQDIISKFQAHLHASYQNMAFCYAT
ncbi:hypothetical protein DPMN_118180 [Dreissena polymorpha]|uniref:non-specific serine/threonine protein kinase n=1 Tax=Dreissena polymorpha TaxID=45954 RepID=A0A9D4GKB0_DREPO|nr:hypothetical protein DPMN_118180 [Dreissena polymorpha]